MTIQHSIISGNIVAIDDVATTLRESFRAYSRQKAAKTAALQAVTFEDCKMLYRVVTLYSHL